MRILIAEDDLTSRTVLASVLSRHGYDVLQVVDGAQALEELSRSDAPKLAVLDWEMPAMDGLEVVRRLRARQSESAPYLIMLTARDGKADVIAGLDAGANDYLAKPFDPGELRSRVEVGRRMVEMQESLLESREALVYEASHDYLTGMLNRRAILEQLRRKLEAPAVERPLLAVALCDIDHFKRVNDTCGHLVGDDVLRGFARIVAAAMGDADVVGRLGGEEFLVLSPTDTEVDALALLERVRSQVAGSPIRTSSGPITVTISIGVAFATRHSTVDQMLESSDRALYQAKREGRNRIVKESWPQR